MTLSDSKNNKHVTDESSPRCNFVVVAYQPCYLTFSFNSTTGAGMNSEKNQRTEIEQLSKEKTLASETGQVLEGWRRGRNNSKLVYSNGIIFPKCQS